MRRALRLRRESLTELTAGELGDVAGGVRDSLVMSCPLTDCVPSIPDCIAGSHVNCPPPIPTVDNCRTLAC